MGDIGSASSEDGRPLSLSDEVSSWRERLADLDGLLDRTDPDHADLDRIDSVDFVDGRAVDRDRLATIEALERLKSAAAAAQARIAAAFHASQLAAADRAGTDPAVARRSVAGEVALARHDSPVRGGRHVGLATALVREMPHTLAALAGGDISEWRATLIVRETACLSREHRSAVDEELAGRMAGWGDRRCAQAARAAAYRLDPAGVVERLGHAANERRVSIRPAPDTMTYLTGLLPVAQGVAAFAALQRHADGLRAAGDSRGRGQIMADELVARLTGTSAAGGASPGAADRNDGRIVDRGLSSGGAPRTAEHSDAGRITDTDDAGTATRLPRDVGIEIGLIITDRALFGIDDEPAMLTGHGPLPAAAARSLVRHAATPVDGDRATVWVRRLYTDRTGRLVAMDSRRRTFPPAARRFIIARDQTCRTPWCDAPIRHVDHVEQASRGGPTTIDNGQGLCENCNYSRAAPGWAARADPDGTVHQTTPSGQVHTTKPPPLHTPDHAAIDLIHPGGDRPRLSYGAA